MIKINLKYPARNKENPPGKMYLAFFHSSDILAQLFVSHALLYGFKNFISTNRQLKNVIIGPLKLKRALQLSDLYEPIMHHFLLIHPMRKSWEK